MEVLAILALLPVLAILAGLAWGVWKLIQGLGWLVGRLFAGVGFLLRRVLTFVRRTLVDTVQTVGALVTAVAILPLAVANLAIGRWSSARHYGRAIEDELTSGLHGLYRVALGNPLRFLGLGPAVEGLERRLPDLVERAPRTRKSRRGAEEFPGYDVLGTLPSGGSGARLFLARPRPETYERMRREGRPLPAEVVVKAFALEQGSTLPQIVRESRALEAAGRLGLVCEHRLDEERFYYVMPYVNGDELDTVTQRLHERASSDGLGAGELALVVGYAQDLLRSLERFHSEGLWHKDVKPANVIVAGDRAHLVDFGLVTPLASAMTLTTHGTEYYRDPEMVRLAMQGVKVHEVDGVKFDLYSAGAVLYSMIEGSFPAHGSLSRLTRSCPEALRWIVHRSMADVGQRYRCASEMLDDLAVLAAAPVPDAVRPADLPSFGGAGVEGQPAAHHLRRVEPLQPSLASLAEGPPDEASASARRPRRSRRSVRRFLVAASVIALFSLGTARVGSALFGSHHLTPSLARHAQLSGAGVFLESSPRLYPPEREAVRMAREVLGEVSFDERVDGLAARWRECLRDTLPSRSPRSSGDTRPKAALDAGRVLVLQGATDSLDRAAVAALEEALHGRGFEVVGASSDEGEDDVRLIAGARHAAGLGDPGDSEAVERVQGFLDRERELEAILWLSAAPESDEALYRILVRRDLAVEPPARFPLDDGVSAVR